MITERDVILAIADGRLPSPQPFFGSCYMALRISGTGAAFRSKSGEYVWRDPSLWTSPRMAERWLGAPIVLTHPAKGSLDTAAYVATVVGAIAHAYPREVDGVAELWAIGRISDMDAAAAIVKYGADTSPAVIFARGTETPIVLENGERWLVERNPQVIDHLAVCPLGTWSKGAEPSGVDLSATQAKG